MKAVHFGGGWFSMVGKSFFMGNEVIQFSSDSNRKEWYALLKTGNAEQWGVVQIKIIRFYDFLVFSNQNEVTMCAHDKSLHTVFFVIIAVSIYPPAVDTEQCHNMMMIRVQIGRSKCCLRLRLYSRTFYNTSWSITYHSRTNQAINARDKLQNKYDFFPSYF